MKKSILLFAVGAAIFIYSIILVVICAIAAHQTTSGTTLFWVRLMGLAVGWLGLGVGSLLMQITAETNVPMRQFIWVSVGLCVSGLVLAFICIWRGNLLA